MRLFDGTLLADDTGTGKTRQVVEVINTLPTLQRILIVCPVTVRIHWRRELEKWLLRPLSIGVAGVDEVSDAILARVNVLVINYDRLVQYRELLESRVWGLAIYDEVHLLKTIEAKRSQVALKIQAVKRLALSGTRFLIGQLNFMESWLGSIPPCGRQKTGFVLLFVIVARSRLISAGICQGPVSG